MYRILPAPRRMLLPAAATTAWLLATFLAGVSALEIRHLHVPQAVQAGSKELILDCDYSYEESDIKDLVVKWYHVVGEPGSLVTQQVYQWIVPNEPQDLGVLRGKLDTKFEVTNDTYTKHRALKIIQPTINLTGEYRCHVSSDVNDAMDSQHMIVYSPPSQMWMNRSDPSDLMVNISCNAVGTYPEPIIQLSITKGKKKTKSVVLEAVQRVTPKGNTFNVVVYKEFSKSTLGAETIFECLLSVPQTTFSDQRTLTFHFDDYVGADKVVKGVDSAPGRHAESESSPSRQNGNDESQESEPTIDGNSATILSSTWSIASLIISPLYLWRFLV